MKNITLLLLCIFLYETLPGQGNVGIGTTTPHATSILELSSTTQGFLLPRMTYVQRLNISSPPTGLMIYQTTSAGFGLQPPGIYYYDGGWKRIAKAEELGGGGNGGWTIAGDNQYSNVDGNVGIGIGAPTSKFHLVGNFLQDNGTMTLNHSGSILQFQNAGINRAFVQLSGNNLRLGTNSNNSGASVIIRMAGADRMTIDSLGNVGIGTSNPDQSAKLHIGGTTRGFLPPRVTTLQRLNDINSPANGLLVYDTDKNEYYQYAGNSWRAILNSAYWSRPITNRSRIANTVDSVGIGTSSPLAKLHIMGGTFANYSNANGYIMLGSQSGSNLVISDYEILARNNGGPNTLRVQQDGGSFVLGSGLLATGTKLQVMGGDPASFTQHGFLHIGPLNSKNIIMDTDEILARDNGAASPMYLQGDGGMLHIGKGNLTSGTKLQITGGASAGLGTHGYIVIGEANNVNMVMDNNEIQVRNNGNASSLFLQKSGGNLNINGLTTINTGGVGEVLKLDGVDPNLGFYQSGALKSVISQAASNLVIQATGSGKIRMMGSQVAIGNINSNAGDYKLTVEGKVICEELKVRLYNQWPDYVFADQYELRPLKDLKGFISEHKHLPNIPKATEVETNGFEVGEMNRKLLEKIEELTLYVIHLQDQLDDMKAVIQTISTSDSQ